MSINNFQLKPSKKHGLLARISGIQPKNIGATAKNFAGGLDYFVWLQPFTFDTTGTSTSQTEVVPVTNSTTPFVGIVALTHDLVHTNHTKPNDRTVAVYTRGVGHFEATGSIAVGDKVSLDFTDFASDEIIRVKKAIAEEAVLGVARTVKDENNIVEVSFDINEITQTEVLPA
jgi:hypothetical protein